jgi:nitrogen fixation NifU-like protein
MSDLRELYQEVIIDHNRHPRNFYKMEDATQQIDGINPLCGDKITIYLKVVDNVIQEASFQGTGCAISIASASLMTDSLPGKTIQFVEAIFKKFHDFITATDKPTNTEELGKLNVLGGVRDYPARIKCATLAWHALHAALNESSEPVSTEDKSL